MRRIAVAMVVASLLSASLVNSQNLETRRSGNTYLLSFKGGVSRPLDATWLMSAGEIPDRRFQSFGISLEFHRVTGVALGVGVEGTNNGWSGPVGIDPAGSRMQIRSWLLYGSAGTYLWSPNFGGRTGWISADVGTVWAIETRRTDHGSIESVGTGPALRLRVAMTQKLTGLISLGADAGWQLARPEISYESRNTLMLDSLGANDSVNLSGPFVGLRLSLIMPSDRD